MSGEHRSGPPAPSTHLGTKQQLRGTVPQGHHDWGVGLQRGPVFPCQPKVPDLQGPRAVGGH